MDDKAIMAVSTAVIALTQVLKRVGWSSSRLAPLVVLLLSAVGTALYVYSAQSFERGQLFNYFVGWILIAAAATGGYETAKSLKPDVVGAIEEKSDQVVRDTLGLPSEKP